MFLSLKWRDAVGRSTGLEPATLGTTNRCSNQLSYDRRKRLKVRRAHRGRGADASRQGSPVAQPEPLAAEPARQHQRRDDGEAGGEAGPDADPLPAEAEGEPDGGEQADHPVAESGVE